MSLGEVAFYVVLNVVALAIGIPLGVMFYRRRNH